MTTTIEYLPGQTLFFSFLPNTVKDWNNLPPDLFTKVELSSNPIITFANIVRGGEFINQ